MREKMLQMIEVFLERERIRLFHDLELFKREILEDFTTFCNNKSGIMCLDDVSENDIIEYCYTLLDDIDEEKWEFGFNRISVLVSFFDFAVNLGWIKKSPWKSSSSIIQRRA